MEANKKVPVWVKRLLGILDTMGDGIYVVSDSFDIEFANNPVLNDFGPIGDAKCYAYLFGRSEPCPWCRQGDVRKTTHWEWECPKTGKIYDTIDISLPNPDGFVSKIKIIRDITSSKRALQDMTDLAKFPSENPFPVLRVAADGIVMYSNGPGGVLLDQWRCKIGQTVPKNWLALVQKALASGRYQIKEITCGDKSYSVAIAPVRDGGYVNLYGRDITKQKQTEKTLREHETLLQAVLDAAPDPIFLKDREGRLLLANPATLAVIGKPAEAVLGKTDVEYYDDPEAARTIMENDRRIMQSGKTEVFEERVTDAQGTRVYRSNKAPYRDGSGRIIGLIGTARNITDRKRAEEELEKMRTLLSEGQKIAHLGSFEYIAATHTTVWSEEEYRIYGLDPSGPSPAYEVMLARCIHPDDAGLLHETFTKAIRDRSIYELEHRIVRPDGCVRVVYDKAKPYFDAAGNLVRYVGITLDITDRKKIEDALRESNEELERFNRAAVGRELRMVELKKEVNALLEQAGNPLRYELGFEKESQYEKTKP